MVTVEGGRDTLAMSDYHGDDMDAVFRPSAADRWITCPGSVALCKGLKGRPVGRAAHEGTAAHSVLETAIKGGPTPEEMVDRRIPVDGAPEPILVDAEMADSVNLFLAELEKRRGQAEVHSEYWMSMQPFADDPLLGTCSGTADVVILDRAARRVTIMDLKYGKGVPVSGDAPQLKVYALLALLNFPLEGGWLEVETVVIQPRLPHEDDRVKAFTFDAVKIYEFGIKAYLAMQAAMNSNAPLVSSEKGCRWCPAKDICPALAREALQIAKGIFGPAPTEIVTAASPQPAVALDTSILPDPVGLTPEQLAHVLDRRAVWETWITAVEQRAVSVLEASPGSVPGWKLVRRSGNRKWTDEDAAVAALRAAGVKTADIYTDPKLKSPAQIEKVMPKACHSVIEGLVSRPEGATTLVRDTDTRSSVKGIFEPVSA